MHSISSILHCTVNGALELCKFAIRQHVVSPLCHLALSFAIVTYRMSGRLILPKKQSYCPWKPNNLKRRDERLEKEHSEARMIQKTQEANQMIELHLREQRQGLLLLPKPQERHINLFFQQGEEEDRLNKISTKDQKQQVGIAMPVVLGQSELKARGENRPFYLRTTEEVKELSSREDIRKDSADPMKDFAKSKNNEDLDDSDEARRHRKKRKSKRRHGDEKRRRKSKSRNDPEEPRRREREASKREAALLRDAPDADRKRAYQNQYNPGHKS